MTAPDLNYLTVYRQLPVPLLLLTPKFRIADANEAYLQVTGRGRQELLGRDACELRPDNPSDPGAKGVGNSIASMRRVLATGEPDAMEFQKYDIEVPGNRGRVCQRGTGVWIWMARSSARTAGWCSSPTT